MISDQAGRVPEAELEPYEKPNASSVTSFFHHLMTEEQRSQEGVKPLMHPGMMDLDDLKHCPPTIVFTSEFDFLRRDALHFI